MHRKRLPGALCVSARITDVSQQCQQGHILGVFSLSDLAHFSLRAALGYADGNCSLKEWSSYWEL